MMTDLTDTIEIDGVTYGPPIPHDPTPVTLSDGTKVSPVCPWPDVVGVVKWSDMEWGSYEPCRLGDWAWDINYRMVKLTAYRLPADHHAYGPKRSRVGREPDKWCNDYHDWWWADIGQSQHYIYANTHRSKTSADASANEGRIGIWRVYMKGEAK